MKILLIADEESKYLWDHYDENFFEDVDFIISAGDLKAKYLSFLTTMTRKRVYYVHGNHDNRYEKDPPLGCDSLEDTIVVQNGVRILGLGGSFRYKPGPHQYTEREMKRRIRRLKAMIHQFGGFDILVTHAPANGMGDGDDLPHRGFECFLKVIEDYKPAYMLHGHQHLNYGANQVRIRTLDETTIINGYNYHVFDYEPNPSVFLHIPKYVRFFNTFRFYTRYLNTPVYREYKKFKRYLKNNNITF